MKSAILCLAASVFLAVPALAQDAAPASGGKGGKMKEAVAACRTEVQTQGIKGADRKKAIMDCVTKEHPEMAGRMQCRQDGQAKGLSGEELKTFIRSCAKSHG